MPGEVAAARLRVPVQQLVHAPHQVPHALVVRARYACGGDMESFTWQSTAEASSVRFAPLVAKEP